VLVLLLCNWMMIRFQVRRLLPTLAIVATAGLTAGLLNGTTAAVIAGFACLGAGVALVIPTVNSAAGRLPGVSQGTGIAMVSACGWAGFVFGPPIIGELASASSLTAALGLLPALTACIAVATARARAIVPRPAEHGTEPDQPG
jgi:hypothetical protein